MKIDSAHSDLIKIAIISIAAFFLFGYLDVFEWIADFSSKHEKYEIDEIISTIIVLVFCLVWFATRRWHESVRKNDVISRRNAELEKALNEIHQLKGIIPLCSICKKVRDDSGYWEQVDTYLQKHSDADISHSLCPECLMKNYPEEYCAIHHKNEDNTSHPDKNK